MPGKDPHRPQGKANADAEHMVDRVYSKGLPHEAPSQSEIAQMDRRAKERGGGPSRVPAEEPLGGSRPGVPSRVRDAIERREEEE